MELVVSVHYYFRINATSMHGMQPEETTEGYKALALELVSFGN